MLFPYTPERVATIKTVVGRRWHYHVLNRGGKGIKSPVDGL